VIDRNAELAGLVGEIVLNAHARKNDDADRHDHENLFVALERRGLRVLHIVWLEGDLRRLAGVGSAGGDLRGALRRSAVHQHHVGVLGVDLIELGLDQLVVGAVAARKGNLRSGGQQDFGFCAALGGDGIPVVDHRGG